MNKNSLIINILKSSRLFFTLVVPICFAEHSVQLLWHTLMEHQPSLILAEQSLAGNHNRLFLWCKLTVQAPSSKHRCGSSSNKQASSKHLFHCCHFWTLTLVIRYIILASSGIYTLHLPVGYLTPCKLRIFFSKSSYYYQHYLNQVLLHWYACQIRWYSFNLIPSTHNICFNSLTWIPFSTHVHFCSAQLCQK